MNNPTPIIIGKSSYGKQSRGFGGGTNWFYIEDNKDNIFRVLPAMKSLAASGRYAKFYRTHRGFRGTDGKQKPFICVEESDFKTKRIKVHCPICDRVAELEGMIQDYIQRGATKEQISEFRNKNIFPIQNEGKYYLNVINQEGKIGVLNIGAKMFNALDALGKQYDAKGSDITGMEGIFLNFKKSTKFKGDRDAVFQVEPFLNPQPDGSFRFVSHSITVEISNRLGPEAADLGVMFKVLSSEQMATIISLEGESRSEYMDTLFVAPEQSEARLSSIMPGSNVQAVSRVEIGPTGGFIVQQPTLPADFNTSTPLPLTGNSGQFQGVQNLAPILPSLGSAPLSAKSASSLGARLDVAPSIPGKSTSMLSDEEFLAIMPRPGK